MLSRLDHCYNEYERVLATLELQWEQESGLNPGDLKGKGRQEIVEAQVRQYLLDPLLARLGWNPSGPQQMVVEEGVATSEAGRNRRHLDYHGQDREPDGSIGSLLLVEAKRASVTLPNVPDVRLGIANALRHHNAGDVPTPLAADWQERLATLVDYAERIEEKTGAPPKVAVISNGDWFIVFDRLPQSLLAKAPSVEAIYVYPGRESINGDVKRFWRMLSYAGLSDLIPQQVPDALPDFMPAGSPSLLGVFTSDINYQTIERPPEYQPAIQVRVLMKVQLPTGAWVTFRMAGTQFVEVRSANGKTSSDLTELSQAAATLLGALRRHATIQLLNPMEAAQHFVDKNGAPGLCERVNDKQYVLVTGGNEIFVNSDSRWNACQYHNFANSQAAGYPHSAGHQGVPKSTFPRIYFADGHELHCSHRAMELERQRAGCFIAGFEESLCCKRCALNEQCYPAGTQRPLPCPAV
jgi:hypothetical protein